MLVVLLMAVAVGSAMAHAGRVSSASTSPTTYYLALGDSIAAGTGASTPADDYVNLVYQYELAVHPGLQVVNLACGGATSTSVVLGPGCSYSTGTQLGDAKAFLAAHPGQVIMATIDIGGNDVDGCVGSGGINATCVQSGLNSISTYLPQILSGLRSVDSTLPIYGMSYYDPFLNQWLTGAAGQTLAQQSESGAVVLNDLLIQLYTAGGAVTADTAGLFQTSNFALTGSYQGVTVPENVALICSWTLMCPGNNIHPNDAGHAEVALAFEHVIDNTPPSTSVLFPGPGTALSGTTLVDAAATDNVRVGRVVFTLTGGALSHAVVGNAVPTLYGYLCFIDTTAVADGAYTLQSVATDTAGNSTTSAGVAITVDNTAPLTSVLFPGPGTALSGTTLVDAAATDNVRVGKVVFTLTGGALSHTVVGNAVPTLYGYLCFIDTTAVADGAYTLQSVATDTAGNSTTSAGVAITVAN